MGKEFKVLLYSDDPDVRALSLKTRMNLVSFPLTAIFIMVIPRKEKDLKGFYIMTPPAM